MQFNNFPPKLESIRQNMQKTWSVIHQWLRNTPERSLWSAYQSARVIKNIELEHFSGQRISPEFGDHLETVMSYWQNSLNRNLWIIKVRLAEFNLSSNLSKVSHPQLLEKLKFIDEVIAKYEYSEEFPINQTREKITPPKENTYTLLKQESSAAEIAPNVAQEKTQTQVNIPVSRTIDFKNAQKSYGRFSGKSEEEFVKNYRTSQNRTKRAVRFLLLLIIIPLVINYLSQRIIISPIVEKIRGESAENIFINSDMKKEAFKELNVFQEALKFESFILTNPEKDQGNIADKIKNKARSIAKEFWRKSNTAISNIFADLISLFTFALIIFLGKKDIFFVKSLIDEIVYGFSDSAKAFIIILFTDIFVGFHSPDGWEVLLEGLAEHLGLPENKSIIFFFIATFPVILATIFKYWIFRYLSRLSPSALATLKEMDD